MSKEYWGLYGYVQSSNHRKDVVLCLSKSPKIPSKIADKLEMRMPHVSKSLSDLTEEGVVKCYNPDKRKGKVYDLTEKGLWVSKKLD
jgi:predicted transcriptional regulator